MDGLGAIVCLLFGIILLVEADNQYAKGWMKYAVFFTIAGIANIISYVIIVV